MKLKQRKSTAKCFRKLREAIQQEDEALRDAQENTRSRAQMRCEEKAARQVEAVARRAEARCLAQKEERDLQRSLQKNNVPRKVTAVELLMQREKELRETEKMAEENAKKQSRVVTEKEYERLVLVENTNGKIDWLGIPTNVRENTNGKIDWLGIPTNVRDEYDDDIVAYL